MINTKKIIQTIHNQSSSTEGFTLVEVIVAILVTTAFIIGALQAVVLATYFKVAAKQSSEATNWITEDLEGVRYSAAEYYPTNIHAAVCDQSNDDDKSYAAYLGGNIVGATAPFGTTTFSTTSTRNITNRTLTMTRTLDVYDTTYNATGPYYNLKVFYDVKDPESTTVAYFQTEVVPAGAFECPSF